MKYPIGVLNRKCYDEFILWDISSNGGMCLKSLKEERLKDLGGAINRYISAGLHLDVEWIKEYNNILTELGIKENIFKL